MFKIEEIFIKNFRSILETRIKVNKLTIFVGNNDAGKSNVLKALNLFFNGETDYDTRFNFDNDYSKLAKKVVKKAPEITISIKIKLPNTYKDRCIIWTQKWRKGNEGRKPNSETINNPENRDALGKFTKQFINNIFYKYIPTIKSEEYFQFLFKELYFCLIDNTEGKINDATQGLSEALQIHTLDISNNIKGNLRLDSKIVIEFFEFFRMLQFQTAIDPENFINLRQRGDGIRTRHIPVILNFIHENSVKNRLKGATPLNTIWGYEEPETAVEFSTCFEFSNEFLRYSDNIPIFITTHSPAFYALADNEDKAIRYFAVNNGSGTKFNRPVRELATHAEMW